ncbi:Ribonuclease T2-like protein [Aduncisulcus paluster]|uniref:Ribonuclease T2-like protein n=1 Tax=Aduncisulcus paluster TaxID=2918883 RepID=A0ABQ5KEE7_9EUKA|nr:Ribonuclease T2-like protein [Aduncisulcus paluster]
MTKILSILIILGIVFSVSAEAANSTSFEMFLFETFWPQTICPTSDRDSSCWLNPCTNSFTIHGNWPENSDRSYPENCGGTSWDENLIMDLYNDLIVNWPDYNSSEGKDGCNSSFIDAKKTHHVDYLWEHEFNKHGTCAIAGDPDVFGDEHDYMSETLYLLQVLNLEGMMNQAGYTAGDSDLVYDDVMDQLANLYGSKVSLKCQSNELFGINACFDLNLNMIDCSDDIISSDYSTCKSHKDAISWPAIVY